MPQIMPARRGRHHTVVTEGQVGSPIRRLGGMNLTGDLERARATRTAIEELIADPSLLGPDFQPVRRLADDAVIAQKATGRGRPGTEVGDTLTLLEGADSLGLAERLDWAWRCAHLRRRDRGRPGRRAAPDTGAGDVRRPLPASPSRVLRPRPA